MVSMAPRRFLDHSQPQTLQNAVVLSYVNAALALVYAVALHATGSYFLGLILLAPAAYGIANERKWGYWGAVVLSILTLAVVLLSITQGGGFAGIFNLLFAVVLVALLLHPMSRSYARAWFRWGTARR